MTAILRFAPSPTGTLHIGSVRTAIFNWVWAKSLNASLVLRIEDTDRERSRPEHESNIMEGLAWLGIGFDEGPHCPKGATLYRQSERIKARVYEPYVTQLVESGHAYYCFETDEELAHDREQASQQKIPYKYSRKSLSYSPDVVRQKLADNIPYTIRFKVPDDAVITLNDAIRGDIPFDTSLLSDFIIVKSDGYPTYNFAVVVDDHEMGITHVVRGEDHISNTPKQIMIYHALGLPCPVFAHLPIILGQDRSKLSKRHGATSVNEYRDNGILPHALFNYLSLLGWSPPGEKELLTVEELVKAFDISSINKAGAVFDPVKLIWMNKQYLNQLDDTAFLEQVHPYVSASNRTVDQYQKKVLSVRNNIDQLAQINQWLDIYALSTQQFMVQFNRLRVGDADRRVLAMARSWIQSGSAWDASTVTNLIHHLMQSMSLGKGAVMKPLRKGITGYESGPNLADCLGLIPKVDVINRLNAVLDGDGQDASS